MGTGKTWRSLRSLREMLGFIAFLLMPPSPKNPERSPDKSASYVPKGVRYLLRISSPPAPSSPISGGEKGRRSYASVSLSGECVAYREVREKRGKRVCRNQEWCRQPGRPHHAGWQAALSRWGDLLSGQNRLRLRPIGCQFLMKGQQRRSPFLVHWLTRYYRAERTLPGGHYGLWKVGL